MCLPTYNERENLEPMLRALGRVLGPNDVVIVIDDASPDGTGELADRLSFGDEASHVVAEAEPTLRLLLRDATELGVELRRPDTELGGDVSCAQRRVVALARFGIR